MKATLIGAVALWTAAMGAHADPAGDLLDQVSALNKSEVQGLKGNLFRGWLQMDEADPSFVVYLNGRRYEVILDDGRGTSQRALSCREENIFDEDPQTGCDITFDGEYVVEDHSGSVEVGLKIWNVNFES